MEFSDYFSREISRLGEALRKVFGKIRDRKIRAIERVQEFEQTKFPWNSGEASLEIVLDISPENFSEVMLRDHCKQSDLHELKNILILMGDTCFSLDLIEKGAGYYLRAINVINYLSQNSDTLHYSDLALKDKILDVLKRVKHNTTNDPNNN